MAITLLAVGTAVSAGVGVAGAIQSGNAAENAANAQLAGVSSQERIANANLQAQIKASEEANKIQEEYLAFMMNAITEGAEDSKRAVGDARNRADLAYGNINSLVGDSYNRIGNIIGSIPQLEQLFPQGLDISRRDFDYRTALKRENLDFTLGNTKNEFREIQGLNADLANLQGEGFLNKYNRIIGANLAGLKASTIGEPTGTFANLSAQNLYNFSQQGLSNYLAINDFYSRNGNVDHISPYTVTQDMLQDRFNRASLNINNEQTRTAGLIGNEQYAVSNEQWRAGAITDINKFLASGSMQVGQSGMAAAQNYFANTSNARNANTNALVQLEGMRADAIGAQGAAGALTTQGIAQSIGNLTQGFASIYGLNQQAQAFQQQQTTQGLLTQNYMNSLNNYAPSNVSANGSTYLGGLFNSMSKGQIPATYDFDLNTQSYS